MIAPKLPKLTTEIYRDMMKHLRELFPSDEQLYKGYFTVDDIKDMYANAVYDSRSCCRDISHLIASFIPIDYEAILMMNNFNDDPIPRFIKFEDNILDTNRFLLEQRNSKIYIKSVNYIRSYDITKKRGSRLLRHAILMTEWYGINYPTTIKGTYEDFLSKFE